MDIPPCKDCDKRAIGCHCTCEEYQKFRKFKDDECAARLEARQKEDGCQEIREHIRKLVRKRGR